VFLTATVTKEEVSSHGGLIGGLPFLAKPVDMAELVACLNHNIKAKFKDQSCSPALTASPVQNLDRSHHGATT
jgi:hypothetical protein